MTVADVERKVKLWCKFCQEYVEQKLYVPLFDTTNNIVNTKILGIDSRSILKRSSEMEDFIIDEVSKVLLDFKQKTFIYEGLIYMMYWLDQGKIIPLYIGKSEKYGKKGDNLSANIKNIHSNKGFFCRWGDNYAYHIGDLSAIVYPNHLPSKRNQKYQKWANKLLKTYPSSSPELRQPTYFWIRAWESEKIGI